MRSRCDKRSISRAAWAESSDETHGDRDGRRGEKSPRSEEEHCCEDQPQGEEPSAEDGIPFAGKAAERQERERVVRARRRPHARFGQREKRGDRGHRDGHGDDSGTRACARDPQAETEHEERKGGDHVPLADVVEILDCEERDLGDEQDDVGGRHCEERTCGWVLLAARHREDDECRGREQRQTERHRDDDPGVPRELRHRAARGSRRLRDLPVRPEQVASPGERNGHECRGRKPDQGQDRRQPSHDRTGAPEPRVERDSDEQRGEQDERLQPYGSRDAHRQQEQALPLERRLLQHAGEREEGGRDERVEEGLGHQQAAVPERRWQHGDRGSARAPSARR